MFVVCFLFNRSETAVFEVPFTNYPTEAKNAVVNVYVKTKSQRRLS